MGGLLWSLHFRHILYILLEIANICLLGDAAVCPPSPPAARAPTRLRQNLFCDYDHSSRPVKKENDTVPLYVTFDVHHVDMEEHHEVMVIEGVLRFMWVDQFLTWFPWNYENVSYLKAEPGETWAPDLTLNLMNMVGVEELKPTSCVLSFSGTVLCLMKVTVQAPCQQDMRHWPYDKHNCSFVVSSYMYFENQLNLTGLTIETRSIKQNRGWDVVGYSSIRSRVSLSATPPVMYYPYVEASFIIRRHSGNFAASTVLPGCMMLVITLSTFWFGKMASMRIQICGFIMLGCVTFLSYLLYLIPPNGDDIPVIITLFRDCMALAAFGVVMAAVVQNLNACEERPPAIIVSLINWIELSVVGRVLLITATSASVPPDDEAAIVPSSSFKPSPWATFTVALDRLAFLISSIVAVVLLLGYIP